jgi:hypothetical protein
MRAALLLWLACCASAAELRIAFPALERLLSQEAFTQEGRRYVRGSPSQKCDFAYLEKPRISGGSGRLVIQARFSGRSAVDVFGRCVGLGDAFDLTIIGTPVFERGSLTVKEVQVGSDKDSFYIRRVRRALASSLNGQLRYDVSAAAKKMLTVPPGTGPYTTEVKDFQVPSVRVDKDAVVLEIQFVLNVK